MLNPFIISNVAEQEAIRQYAELEVWQCQCRALGATDEQINAYEQDARQYAATTVHPNTLVVAYARRVAREALARGEPMPTSAKDAIRMAELREMARLINH